MAKLVVFCDRLDTLITQWLARYAITCLRLAMGIVFFWFGILKFIPHLSPAEDLAARTIALLTFGVIPPHLSLVLLASWECLIGLGLLTGYWLRATLVLLLLQMAGTITPLFFFPHETFLQLPYAPTLEGQYILKNMVLVTGALVIGATVRGGHIHTEAAARPGAPAPGSRRREHMAAPQRGHA